MVFSIKNLDTNRLFDDAIYRLCKNRPIRGFGCYFDSRVLISLLTHSLLIWVAVVMALHGSGNVLLLMAVGVNVGFIALSLWFWRLPKSVLGL